VIMTHRHCWLAAPLALCAFAFTASVPSHAQVERSGGGETQKIMQQYQQVAAEKTALQAQVAQMKKDLDTAKSDLAAAQKERDALKVRAGGAAAAAATVTQLTASKESAEKNLEVYKQRMNELVGRFRETATNLKEVEADRSKLHKDLDERNAAFDKCAENNLQLYEINKEVLDRYEHVGLFTKTSAAEPFTQITRTRIENLVDEYRARALENRTQKHTP
jgi:chromosome segregation ATPase